MDNQTKQNLKRQLEQLTSPEQRKYVEDRLRIAQSAREGIVHFGDAHAVRLQHEVQDLEIQMWRAALRLQDYCRTKLER